MQTQLVVKRGFPSSDLIIPVRNQWVKPDGGFWTSTLLDQVESDWVRWCQREMPELIKGYDRYALEVDSGARVYTIDSLDDLVRLHQAGYTNPSPEMRWAPGLDFERLAEVYDGIRLTKRGQVKTRYSRPYSLYGWDVESTLWFRWVFTNVRRVYP